MTEVSPPDVTRSGFVPLVSGTEVHLQQSCAFAVLARGDVSVYQGGANLLLVGGDLSVEQGGGQTIIAKGDVSIRQGGALVAAAPSVTVQSGWVGLALGGRVELKESRVLLGPAQAAALGAGLGVVFALARRLLRR